jgi:hypothetical protein
VKTSDGKSRIEKIFVNGRGDVKSAFLKFICYQAINEEDMTVLPSQTVKAFLQDVKTLWINKLPKKCSQRVAEKYFFLCTDKKRYV